MAEKIQFTCSVEKIRFFKDDWGIIIVSVDKIKQGEVKKDKFGQVILKGTMPKPVEGSMYNAIVTYAPDPQWGDQYEIISFYSAIEFGENDKVGQKKFLSSLFTPREIENMYKEDIEIDNNIK